MVLPQQIGRVEHAQRLPRARRSSDRPSSRALVVDLREVRRELFDEHRRRAASALSGRQPLDERLAPQSSCVIDAQTGRSTIVDGADEFAPVPAAHGELLRPAAVSR